MNLIKKACHAHKKAEDDHTIAERDPGAIFHVDLAVKVFLEKRSGREVAGTRGW